MIHLYPFSRNSSPLFFVSHPRISLPYSCSFLTMKDRPLLCCCHDGLKCHDKAGWICCLKMVAIDSRYLLESVVAASEFMRNLMSRERDQAGICVGQSSCFGQGVLELEKRIAICGHCTVCTTRCRVNWLFRGARRMEWTSMYSTSNLASLKPVTGLRKYAGTGGISMSYGAYPTYCAVVSL